MLSTETLQLCRSLVAQVGLDPNAKDLIEQARIVSTAREELDAALAEAKPED